MEDVAKLRVEVPAVGRVDHAAVALDTLDFFFGKQIGHVPKVPRANMFRDRQFVCDLQRQADLVNIDEAVGADDGPRRVIDALAEQGAATASLLAFEALRQAAQLAILLGPRRRPEEQDIGNLQSCQYTTVLYYVFVVQLDADP